MILLVDGIISASCRARIDEELAIMFIGFKLMGVASNQNIHSKLPLKRGQGFRVSPRNYLMTVCETNLELTNSYNFLLRI